MEKAGIGKPATSGTSTPEQQHPELGAPKPGAARVFGSGLTALAKSVKQGTIGVALHADMADGSQTAQQPGQQQQQQKVGGLKPSAGGSLGSPRGTASRGEAKSKTSKAKDGKAKDSEKQDPPASSPATAKSVVVQPVAKTGNLGQQKAGNMASPGLQRRCR